VTGHPSDRRSQRRAASWTSRVHTVARIIRRRITRLTSRPLRRPLPLLRGGMTGDDGGR
jgi:hypothetical protein